MDDKEDKYEDDIHLWVELRQTKAAAIREGLIVRYVPLVHFVLGRLGLEAGPEYQDLAGQGLLGLIDAVDRFDPTRGTKFSTYGIQRIRGQIVDALRTMDLLSRPARRRVREIERATVRMQTDLGRQPTLEELADHMQLNVAQLQKSYGDASRVLISLDAPLPNGESLYDTLPDNDPEVNPTAVMMESELHLSLKDALQTLPDRDRQLLSLYYVEELTMRDIGEVLGVSESRVSQMHAKAVIELRATMQRAQQRPASPVRPAAAQPAPVPQRRILQEVTA